MAHLNGNFEASVGEESISSKRIFRDSRNPTPPPRLFKRRKSRVNVDTGGTNESSYHKSYRLCEGFN
jgi:hypothetical protein